MKSSNLVPLSTLLLLGSLLLTAPVYGQDAVTVVSAAAYARYGTKLYVAGGGYGREVKAKRGGFNTDNEFIANPEGQFMVLDLSVPWDISAPAWKRLANGPTQGTFSAAFSTDGKTLATFRSEANITASSHFIWLYHVDNDTWSQSNVSVPDPGKPGRYAVTDPTTNTVYLPGGFEKGDSFPMLIYSFDKDSTTQPPLPGRLVDVSHYKAVWWAQKQSILYFGGYVGSQYEHAAPSIIQFTPSTNAWTTLVSCPHSLSQYSSVNFRNLALTLISTRTRKGMDLLGDLIIAWKYVCTNKRRSCALFIIIPSIMLTHLSVPVCLYNLS